MATDSDKFQSLSAVHHNQRSEERFHVPVDVELESGADIPELATLRDISTQGVGLEHSRPLNVGQVVSCRLLDSPFDSSEIYRIEILWSKTHEDGSFLSGGRILKESEPG